MAQFMSKTQYFAVPLLFKQLPSKSKNDGVFVYTNWKDATASFKEHENSVLDVHESLTTKCKEEKAINRAMPKK